MHQWTRDFKFKVRGYVPMRHKIVVVHIDSFAIEKIGRWPWHRDVSALLIDRVFELGAKVVGLDITFSELDQRIPEDLKEYLTHKKMNINFNLFETDEALVQTISQHKEKLVLAWIAENACYAKAQGLQSCPVDASALKDFWPAYQEKFAIKNIDSFDEAKGELQSFLVPLLNNVKFSNAANHAGYINVAPDSDGFIRKSLLLSVGHKKIYPSLALKMAEVGLEDEITIEMNASFGIDKLQFKKSQLLVPVSSQGELEINFRGPRSQVAMIPAADVFSESSVFEQANNPYIGQLKSLFFQDAYVLIGISAIGVNDLRQFPFEPNSPGVIGHAQILDNILSQDALQKVCLGWNGLSFFSFFMLTIGVFLIGWILNSLNALWSVFISFFYISGIMCMDYFLFLQRIDWPGEWLALEFFTFSVLNWVAKYIQEEKNKKFIKQAFIKYVSPLIVDQIIQDPKRLSLSGEKRDLTIFFSDIRNFTTFSEQMDPKLLVKFLNEYLGLMTEVIFSYAGTLDKYIGDAIMAFWGAPLYKKEHPSLGLLAAQKMQNILKEKRPYFIKHYGVHLEVGMGVHSGLVNVGNMGSENNFQYTVMGDHVNLTSRLESLTKYYNAKILTTRFTLEEALKSHSLQYRLIDCVKVKGKNQAIDLIEIMEDANPQILEMYQQAFYEYQNAHFAKAAELFEQIAQMDDKASKVLGERCQFLKNYPQDPNFDVENGSWTLNFK